LLGFQKALRNLDEVIRIIRAAKQPKDARDGLIAQFEFSEKQAQAIIELQLQRLTGMEQQKILDELAEIQRRIAGFLEILGSDKVLRDVIVRELREVEKDYGDERRTEIIEDTGEIRLEDLVAVEDVAITVTRGGYLKRTSVDTYRRQTRGGKGRIGMGTRAEDFVEHLIVASTHSYLLIFTTRGRVYWLKAYEMPDASTTGKGKHISNLINLQPDETPKAFLAVKDLNVHDQFVVMVTRHGVIKKSELAEFDNPMSRGIIAVSLDEGDELIGAMITHGDNYMFLGSRLGQAIRFAEGQVRPMGRQARGVRAMDLAVGDYLVGMEVVEREGLILSIAENGYGKRTPLENYRLTGRGGKGVINMKTTRKTGDVVAILSVMDDSDLMIVSQNGKIIRIESSTIRQVGRSTQGVRLVSLEEGDKVAAASVIPDAGNGNGEGPAQEDLPLQ
jgi:DNA gyrase subunit A